jgi:hypothetical protein
MLNWFKKTKDERKVYSYCLHNVVSFHPITDSLLIGFLDIIKHDQSYERNAPVYLDEVTRHYFLEGWELDRRIIDTVHKTDAGYNGHAYQYKDQFHPLISTEFELNNWEDIVPTEYYHNGWRTRS